MHCLRDVTQLYIVCDPRDPSVTVARIEACVDEIHRWMPANMLALNDTKTEIVWFSERSSRDGGSSGVASSVRVGAVNVVPVDTVRDLGVLIDSAGLMDNYLKSVCGKAAQALWRIGKIRHLLDQKSTEKLIHAFVTSKLDYGNSLLFGLPDYKLKSMQHIQNSAARLVVRARMERGADMSPILMQLHWLPIVFRIEFKLLCIIFKLIRHGASAPAFLLELITIQSSAYRTRSSTEVRLAPFSFREHGKKTTKKYGDRAFQVAAPQLWNRLPSSIRCIEKYEPFKTQVKTHLFRRAHL